MIGLARALIDTIGEREAAEILAAEFGWDLAFQALALLPNETGRATFGIVWELLLEDALREDLDERSARPRD